MVRHGASWCFMVLHGASWVSWRIMVLHGFSWGFMVLMVRHGASWCSWCIMGLGGLCVKPMKRLLVLHPGPLFVCFLGLVCYARRPQGGGGGWGAPRERQLASCPRWGSPRARRHARSPEVGTHLGQRGPRGSPRCPHLGSFFGKTEPKTAKSLRFVLLLFHFLLFLVFKK